MNQIVHGRSKARRDFGGASIVPTTTAYKFLKGACITKCNTTYVIGDPIDCPSICRGSSDVKVFFVALFVFCKSLFIH